MPGTLRFYSWGHIDSTINDNSFGVANAPHKEIALTADTVRLLDELVVNVGETVTIWAYDANRPAFDLLWLSCLGGAGYLELAWFTDEPTSSSNLAAKNTCPSWDFLDLSCHAPFVMTGIVQKVNPTMTNSHGDTAGNPTRWTSGTTVQGRVYKVLARNPSNATAAVRIKRAVVY